MNNYRIDFMMRTFATQDTAEWFADQVDGVCIYDRETGLYIVRW